MCSQAELQSISHQTWPLTWVATLLAGDGKRDTVDAFMEGMQALPGRLEAFLQARRAPAAGDKAVCEPLLASKLRADAGEAIRVRARLPGHRAEIVAVVYW